MERRIRRDVYEIVLHDEEPRRASIYLLDKSLRMRFKENCLFSYDGRNWTKCSGGKSVDLDELPLSDEDKRILLVFFGNDIKEKSK